MAKLVFGCGYLGFRVARLWRDLGEDVFVVTRNGDHARRFSAQGLNPIVADVTRPESLLDLPTADAVLYAIGFDRHAGPSVYDVFVSGLQSVLKALPAASGKVIYVSSTGVYGQRDGGWVDEDSRCEPEREAGKACLAAEQILMSACNSRAIVLRMAGLYGPHRIPNADDLRRGRPIAAPRDGFLNLIHVEDAAAIVLAAAERVTPPRTYVVSDGHPVPRHEYYAELARLLDAPPPQFAAPPADSAAAARASADKRVSNRRMMAELRVELQFPSYREGLAAIVAASDDGP